MVLETSYPDTEDPGEQFSGSRQMKRGASIEEFN